jgi:hypothetical protein
MSEASPEKIPHYSDLCVLWVLRGEIPSFYHREQRVIGNKMETEGNTNIFEHSHRTNRKKQLKRYWEQAELLANEWVVA